MINAKRENLTEPLKGYDYFANVVHFLLVTFTNRMTLMKQSLNISLIWSKALPSDQESMSFSLNCLTHKIRKIEQINWPCILNVFEISTFQIVNQKFLMTCKSFLTLFKCETMRNNSPLNSKTRISKTQFLKTINHLGNRPLVSNIALGKVPIEKKHSQLLFKSVVLNLTSSH